MVSSTNMNLSAFIDRWIKSGSSERANKGYFLEELCQVLDLRQPDPKRGDRANEGSRQGRRVLIRPMP